VIYLHVPELVLVLPR